MRFNELLHQDPQTKIYLGSPSLVRAPDGALVATHDYFGPGCPRNRENEEHLTSVYRSEDNGVTWKNLTHIASAYWSTLFMHRGLLYLLGTSQQYGSIVIRKSADGGFTWSHPKDASSGLLFRGGPFHENPNYHGAPVPVVVHKGRIWRAFEDCRDVKWGQGFESFAISAPEDADFLDASSWTMSEKLPFHPDWEKPEWRENLDPAWPKSGWLEGNIVVTPENELVNIIRFYSPWVTEVAARIHVSADGKKLSFDPKKDFLNFPGGRHKFTIRRDPVSGLYVSLVNDQTVELKLPGSRDQRNRLSLVVSKDLCTWDVKAVILQDDLPISPEASLRGTGFQYADWQFDGEDLIALVRTAYDGANSFHDSNRITFHRLKHYLKLIKN